MWGKWANTAGRTLILGYKRGTKFAGGPEGGATSRVEPDRFLRKLAQQRASYLLGYQDPNGLTSLPRARAQVRSESNGARSLGPRSRGKKTDHRLPPLPPREPRFPAAQRSGFHSNGPSSGKKSAVPSLRRHHGLVSQALELPRPDSPGYPPRDHAGATAVLVGKVGSTQRAQPTPVA